MGKGDEEAEDEEVELEMAEAVGLGERMVGLGRVIAGRLNVGRGGGNEMVEAK